MSDFFAGATGATAIEYALIAALISIAILGALNKLGNQMNAMYSSIASAMP